VSEHGSRNRVPQPCRAFCRKSGQRKFFIDFTTVQLQTFVPSTEEEKMSTTEKGMIRIDGEGGLPVSEVRQLLSTIEHAYNSLLIFEAATEPASTSRTGGVPIWTPEPKFSLEESMTLVLPSDRLVLQRVELASPGFWEFMGTLNPLEVIRKYLQDRHERQKDRAYRAALEAEKMRMQILLDETELIGKRLRIAKEVGAPEHITASLLNELVYRPLEDLGAVQDKGLIVAVPEVRRLSEGKREVVQAA